MDRLTQLSCLVYFGVKLDVHLTWNEQIDAVCKKLVFTISRLSRLKNVFAMHILIYIYQSIVQPQVDYAITIWVFTSQQNISKVQRLQNRAAGNFYYVHVRGIDIVKQLKWMNVTERRDYFMALSVFKCLHGMAPQYLSDCITMNDEVVIRDTRASTSTNILMMPHAPLEIFKNSFSHRGPPTWNALPESIKKCATLNIFIKLLERMC